MLWWKPFNPRRRRDAQGADRGRQGQAGDRPALPAERDRRVRSATSTRATPGQGRRHDLTFESKKGAAAPQVGRRSSFGRHLRLATLPIADSCPRPHRRFAPVAGTQISRSALDAARDIRILLRMSSQRSRELRCPRAEQDDLRLRGRPAHLSARPGARRRQPLGRDRRCAPSLRRRRGGQATRASTRSPSASGPARAARSASSASSSASGRTRRRAASRPTASTAAGPASSSSTSSAAPTGRWSTREGKPAGWRGYLGIGNISYGAAPGRVDPRGHRDPRRAARRRSRPSSSTWSPARTGSRWSRTSTSDPRRGRPAAEGQR